MAPRKRHHIESLEELSLRVVLSWVVADLHLAHLLSTDLRNSLALASAFINSPDTLKESLAARLSVLPGLLNDQVRAGLVRCLFASPEPERWPNDKLDILQAILDDSIIKIDCGSQTMPRKLLSLVGECCPNLDSLKVSLRQNEPYSDMDDLDSDKKLDLSSKNSFPYPKLFQNYSSRVTRNSVKVSRPSSSLVRALIPLTQLTTLHLAYGANNDILATLGKCAPQLKELRMCYSYSVTDAGLKSLCLSNPENHVQRKGRHLHELRVRSFHLNPCVLSLAEVDIVGTGISPYGVAFLLKHVPSLRSLGDCTSVSEAIEVLVGSKTMRRTTFFNKLRKHTPRYKLTKVKEDRVSAFKVLTVSMLCPELKDLILTHKFLEVDLDRSMADYVSAGPNNITTHLSQLKQLKHLTLKNVCSRSVGQVVRACGQQLTALTVQCRGLDIPCIFSSCPNLKYLTMEGQECIAPYEAVEDIRHSALSKLKVVKIKCHLPFRYADIILSNSSHLSKLEFDCLCDISDDRVSQLMRNKSLDKLKEFDVFRAPKLTVTSAKTLVRNCPELRQLQDLGGWNISSEEYNAFVKELEVENYDISITYKPRRNRVVSHTDDDIVEDSDQESDVLVPLRNIFPLFFL